MLTKEQLERISLPRTQWVKVSTITQYNVSAHTVCAESYDNMFKVMCECQAIADETGLPTVLTGRESGERFTFYPGN